VPIPNVEKLSAEDFIEYPASIITTINKATKYAVFFINLLAPSSNTSDIPVDIERSTLTSCL
jgi:hypothetical protein